MEAATFAAIISALLVAGGSGYVVKTAPESCVFPFIYGGVTHYKCIDDGLDKYGEGKWCSLTSNYDTDRRGKVCDEKENVKATLEPCVFPFIYKKFIYNGCTIAGWGKDEAKRPWCSLSSNYDINARWKLCEDDLTGENVALGGRATQSSTYTGEGGYLGLAVNAIDGNQDPEFWRGSCSHTNNDYSPWWRVDLRRPHVIHSIAITGRNILPERLNGADILVGNSLENHGNNNPRCASIPGMVAGVTLQFQCHGMIARYVNIVIPRRLEWLALCEVEVFGVPTHLGPEELS